MSNGALLQDWPPERNRAEFLKWLDILDRLVDGAPTDWVLWTQTREAQEILATLARRLEFPCGPIERRTEVVMLTTERGRERHDRRYVVATDPVGASVAERFDGWIDCLDTKPATSVYGVRGGLPEPEFRQQVLALLARWRAAVGSGT